MTARTTSSDKKLARKSSGAKSHNYASALISRLSGLIIVHTILTFAAAILLFAFPEIGPNADDIEAQNTAIKDRARALVTAYIESGQNSNSPVVRQALADANITTPGLRTQSLYRVKTTGAAQPELIAEWENDLERGSRITESERLRASHLAQTFANLGDEVVERVSGEDFDVTRIYAAIDAPGTETSDEKFIYRVTMLSKPPIVVGARLALALVVSLLLALLVALLILHALNRNLSRPLSELERAFQKLSDSDDKEITEPVKANLSGKTAASRLLERFNDMSTRLFERRQQVQQQQLEIAESARELSESKNLLETIVEGSPDAYIVTDFHGEILWFNHRGREIFGYVGPEPVPTHIDDLFNQEMPANGSIQFGKRGQQTYERLGVRADSAKFPALVVVTPLRQSGEETRGYIFVIREISESRQFQEMITRLDNLSVRGEMASDIAHEINNFLAIIQGNTELLPILIDRGDREKIKDRLGLIHKTVGRIASFTEGLMSFDSKELRFTPEDTNQLIHNLMAFLKPQNRVEHVQFDLQLDQNISIATFDAALVQQALASLIHNAADALKDQPGEHNVTIRTAQGAKDTLKLTVSDNGPGIPEELRSKLFKERFSNKRRGLGIGLVTCARIAKLHQGEISYAVSESGGAEFTIEIPMRQHPDRTKLSESDIAEPESLKSLVS